MSRVSSLYHLQEIDLDLDARRARLAEIERALAGNPAVQAARTRLLSADTAARAARTALQSIEFDNGTLASKITEAEQQLYSGAIRNPKELRDLQAEIDSLKRRLAAGEEQQLNALIEAESAETTSVRSQAELQAAEETAARSNLALSAERDGLQARVASLQVERDALTPALAPGDLQTYERLRQTKHGRALARLEEGTCAACGITPSALVRQEARRGSELARCTGCDRILYLD